MRASEYAEHPGRVEEGGNGHRPVFGFMFQGQQVQAPLSRAQALAAPRRVSTITWPAVSATWLELITSASGLGLAIFMLMHLSLLSTVLVGAQTMDDLGGFLERYYLLHAGIGPLILLGLVHMFLSLRKVPTTFRQQRILVSRARGMAHLDTWTWVFQVLSGAAVLMLASIHLWVMLTDLPIEASKSGEHVAGFYLWLDIPFVLFVWGHLCVGLYRIAVKRGLLARRWAYWALATYATAALALSFAVMASFYRLGGD
jgi:fumarate reductase subunit C